jgi:MinD-like ATPase involved in chromosome partitioning or flagellar assembly
VRTGQLIAVGSAKGGTGKDSIAITLGDVIASALLAPTLVLDADWDFGTLGERAPEEGRSPGTVLDVHAVRDQLVSPAQLGQFVARMPSGCHLLSAPRDPDEMERLEVRHYAEVLETLRRFYSVIFVTMAPGVLAPVCKWAFAAADQIVFVTDTRRVTADQTLRALPLLRRRHPDVPLTLVINQVPAQPSEPQRHVIEAQLDTGYADRDLLVPYDPRLEQQLDSGTLDLEDPDLPGRTRIALKQATLAVAERLG